MTTIKITLGHNNRGEIVINPVEVEGDACCEFEERLIDIMKTSLNVARAAFGAGIEGGLASSK